MCVVATGQHMPRGSGFQVRSLEEQCDVSEVQPLRPQPRHPEAEALQAGPSSSPWGAPAAPSCF